MLKKSVCVLILIVLIVSMAVPVAAAPTDSYTRVDVPGGVSEVRPAREMYKANQKITAHSLGIQNALEDISDVCSCVDGSILILCGDDSRIVKINSDYTYNCEISLRDEANNIIDFSGAQGIFSDENNDIFIADTKNARIIVADSSGLIKEILNTPESKLIPDDFKYNPVSVARDSKGYTYILSSGCYYGALQYSPDNEFMGFYGANTVKSSALDTLSYLWDRLTSNEVKQAASVKELPYSFVDFCLDSDGYLITCTGSTDTETIGQGQIRMISPNGTNILYKRNLRGGSSTSDSVNFLEEKSIVKKEGSSGAVPQNIVSITVNDDNYIFALDRTNGTIYVYDIECNLLSAFGGGLGEGEQLGTFKTPIALALSGSSILVADSDDMSITVFEQTEYASLFYQAQTCYLKGDYVEAKSLWENVLENDRNNQLAYRGLAMVYYMEGDYEKSLEFARIASDYTVYDLAYQAVLSKFLANNFIWIILAVLVIISAIIIVLIKLKKQKKVLITNNKIKLLLSVPLHPFSSFDDLKYKKLGSLKIAVSLTVLYYLAQFLRDTASGFLYTDTVMKNYNSLYTLGGTVGLIVLWSVSNWLVCTLFSGKGTFKEVYVSTIYSILPYVCFMFISVALTHLLPLSASGIISGLETAVLIYTLFLLCVAMMKIHEYDFFKFLLTSIVTILFMILVVFVIFMCVILLQQVGQFISSVYTEIRY